MAKRSGNTLEGSCVLKVEVQAQLIRFIENTSLSEGWDGHKDI